MVILYIEVRLKFVWIRILVRVVDILEILENFIFDKKIIYDVLELI